MANPATSITITRAIFGIYRYLLEILESPQTTLTSLRDDHFEYYPSQRHQLFSTLQQLVHNIKTSETYENCFTKNDKYEDDNSSDDEYWYPLWERIDAIPAQLTLDRNVAHLLLTFLIKLFQLPDRPALVRDCIPINLAYLYLYIVDLGVTVDEHPPWFIIVQKHVQKYGDFK